MRTKIYFADGLLIAVREDGLRLSDTDAVRLADLLWANNVASSEVWMTDWHEDPEHAPMSGHKVAVFQRLHQLEQPDEIVRKVLT
jgi:hypothetical protein